MFNALYGNWHNFVIIWSWTLGMLFIAGIIVVWFVRKELKDFDQNYIDDLEIEE